MKTRVGGVLLTLTISLGAVAPALAADDPPPPPPVRAGSPGFVTASKPKAAGSKKSGVEKYVPALASGNYGVRPMLGAWGELDVNDRWRCCAVEGNKFVFGADLHVGKPTGLGFGLGLHLGAGDGDFVVQVPVEATYRFDLGLGLPLIPWAGGGLSLKSALTERFELALTFRGVFGVEYYLTDKVGFGIQLTLPDLGPIFVPERTVVGTVEVTLGAHIRL